MIIDMLKKIKNKLIQSKTNSKLKQQIKIRQMEEKIFISGSLNNKDYKVKKIMFVSRNTGERIAIDVTQTSSFNFEASLDLSEMVELYQLERQIFNLFLVVQVPKSILSDKKSDKLEKVADKIVIDEEEFFEYPIRLGRFHHTDINNLYPVTIFGNESYLYKTLNGNVSFSVNQQVVPNSKLQIDFLRSKGHRISFGGKLFSKHSRIEEIKLLIIGRETNLLIEQNTVSTNLLVKETQEKFGLNRYKYRADINLNNAFSDNTLGEDIYDLYFEIKYHDFNEKVRVRIGNPRFKARYYTRSSSAVRENETLSVSPYYTIKRFNLSLQVDSFEPETYAYLRRLMRWSWLLRLVYLRKNIWIVGERPYKAQDTGYRFFKYVRNNHSTKNVYYVIKQDSPELKNIEEYGNALYFKSKKHIKYVLIAKRIIGSHHPDYLYPLRTKEFNRKVKAQKIFLQHGVLGTKNTEHFYSKSSPSFTTDLFLVSSDYERSIVINDFDYKPEEVAVTGLSRFDSLFAGDTKQKRQLLIIPTWREWLVRDDIFLDSDYFQRYRDMVFNERLIELAKKYDFEIVFCLHPNMQNFTPYFKEASVKVISQGEMDVQDLLKESAMMITDYSSVAFDFSFLEKPIVYYQFDRKRFIGKRGSHIDLDEDLPGDIVYDLDNVISQVEIYAENGFKMKEENKNKAKKFLKYRDQHSSERIYNAISNKVNRKPIYKSVIETEFYQVLFKRFRKSKYYFPTMKLFYKIAKKVLKVDDKLILFESGVGKQYSDSPRFIYEEIVERGLDYKKVWVCNKKVRFIDQDTIKVKRLSPSYYYYLAKAKIWVNNQNFPTYIEKRPQTTYLQTWHGTPLKKMLFDIQNIMGRSDDYLDRVSKATKTWDYLISPSTYATKAFKSAFKYEGEILETGYPRNDIFYNNNRDSIGSKIKSKLNIPVDKKIILYAPTFRDNQSTTNNKFIFDINMDLEKMQERLGEEYIILLRMHVVINNKLNIDKELRGFVQNVSNYSDIQELLLITDILITDYSSVMFDFANTKRPLLFYTYDLETYRDNIRGFYLDFENEAPGPLIKTTDEIIENVENIDRVKVEYKQKYDNFYSNYCKLDDGKASERIVDLIFDNKN
ncbi:CDP-glycerol glycerophosphotransferase family protein [Oceanobacillus sp. M65]|uniref:CDP-glycerol glycerophosphotransferase family protein n=1 Tax=Oceanobacillus sp. M65 TaxID=3457435 RepID=UPI003FCD33E0